MIVKIHRGTRVDISHADDVAVAIKQRDALYQSDVSLALAVLDAIYSQSGRKMLQYTSIGDLCFVSVGVLHYCRWRRVKRASGQWIALHACTQCADKTNSN